MILATEVAREIVETFVVKAVVRRSRHKVRGLQGIWPLASSRAQFRGLNPL